MTTQTTTSTAPAGTEQSGTAPASAAPPGTAPASTASGTAPRDIRRLRRRADRRLLGGVCGGFADYSGADVGLVRVLMVALTIFGGTGFALYAAAWLLVPVEGSTRSPAERLLRQ
jgi:phage shock protein PspC (stress-responsive transcriptional regulator)